MDLKLYEQLRNLPEAKRLQETARLAYSNETEFHHQLALWGYEKLNDIRPKPFPTPPQKWIDYCLADRKTKEKLKGTLFWVSLEGYLDTCRRIEEENIAQVEWIHQWIDWMPETEEDKKNILRQKIYEFYEAEHRKPQFTPKFPAIELRKISLGFGKTEEPITEEVGWEDEE